MTIVDLDNAPKITQKRDFSWYRASAVRAFSTFSSDEVPNKCDVAIIGGGLTGIGAALCLAKSGVKAHVFEMNEIGHGASGRNGGLVCSGYRHDQKWFEQRLGVARAHDFWQLAEAAKTHLQNLMQQNGIDADYESGLLFCAHNQRMLEWLNDDMVHLSKNYGYNQLSVLDKADCGTALGTDTYFGGILDKGAGKLHPLKLLYGMTKAAIESGAIIHENSRITGIKIGETPRLQMEGREIAADKILICGDGYLKGLEPKIENKVMPISSFVLATEPIECGILQGAAGGMDTRFVVNYFQRTIDNRLIFGGGEKYTPNWPPNITQFVRNNLLKVFPHLNGAKIDYAWGGLLGITPTRLPYVNSIAPNIFSASGYSGQGVLFAPFYGDILGKMLLGDARNFELLGQLPVPDFPGGATFRYPLLTAAMSYYSILDKLP